MAKIVVECSDPNDLKELGAAMEQAAGKCNITYFKQHKAMVAAGKSKGQRESARRIATDTGESPAAVESRIRRGKAALRHDDAPIDAEFRVVSTRGANDLTLPVAPKQTTPARKQEKSKKGKYADYVELKNISSEMLKCLSRLQVLRVDAPNRIKARGLLEDISRALLKAAAMICD